MRLAQTIVAPITALGGAVAVVRVSGPEAWALAEQVFAPWPQPVRPRRAVYGRFTSGDDGLAVAFAEGASYTGEMAVEFSVHGSPASVEHLVAALIAAGARTADPGEFTLRAFLFGRMDLTQAEGVRDLVAAQTDAQLRQAADLREGALAARLAGARGELVAALASVEAAVDFSEEVGDLDRLGWAARLAAAGGALRAEAGQAERARRVREGARVVLVGLPNAGKSSLLNALLGTDRAIVTPQPGTTRDTLEELVAWEGVPIRLIDTAGLRATSDIAEAEGVRRTEAAIAQADLVLHLADGTLPGPPETNHLLVRTKSDLAAAWEGGLAVSARTGEGLDALRQAVLDRVGTGEGPAPLVNARHVPLLLEAAEAAERAAATLVAPVPEDLAAVDLQAALRALGELTGETAGADVLQRLFSDFCLGK